MKKVSLTMKRILAAALSGMMVLTMLTACGNGGGDSKNTAASEKSAGTETAVAQSGDTKDSADEKKLIYVIIKNRGDLSFWDSIAEGGDKAAADFTDRAEVKVIETTNDLNANLSAMYEAADAGADLILTAADFKDNLVEIAQSYPDTACIMISENIVDQSDNIYGFDFVVSEASFLAGIVAADKAAQEGSDTIGFIGGVDETVVIQEFFVGYIQGAKYYNPDINIVYNYVGDWNDPDTARTQAEAQFNNAGAAVIFACAGGSGNGVHTAAANTGNFIIGVDSDQSLLYDADPEIQQRFITSVLKLCNNAVYNTIDRFLADGTLPFGQMDIMGIKEDAVGIVENDLFKENISEDGLAKLSQAREDISSGNVTVWSAIGKDQTEIQGKIAEMINN